MLGRWMQNCLLCPHPGKESDLSYLDLTKSGNECLYLQDLPHHPLGTLSLLNFISPTTKTKPQGPELHPPHALMHLAANGELLPGLTLL